MIIEVSRSLWKVWVAGLLAVPMMFLAIELLVTDFAVTNKGIEAIEEVFDHDTRMTFGPPETTENGGLTHQGKSELVTDWIWALVLFSGGGVLGSWALVEIAFPRRILAADAQGIHLGLLKERRSYVLVPWHQIRSLRSTALDGEAGRSTALELAIVGDHTIPDHPYGAVWDGNLLIVDADGWDVEPHELAGQLDVLREQHTRPLEDVPLD